ncbi:hypothetical protein SPHINGOT1_610042 [Sphingomonas sp. T1]|nr:hypothetical protein SPHINGOT1_610042 [Sphingomonas sp. T1]
MADLLMFINELYGRTALISIHKSETLWGHTFCILVLVAKGAIIAALGIWVRIEAVPC